MGQLKLLNFTLVPEHNPQLWAVSDRNCFISVSLHKRKLPLMRRSGELDIKSHGCAKIERASMMFTSFWYTIRKLFQRDLWGILSNCFVAFVHRPFKFLAKRDNTKSGSGRTTSYSQTLGGRFVLWTTSWHLNHMVSCMWSCGWGGSETSAGR